MTLTIQSTTSKSLATFTLKRMSFLSNRIHQAIVSQTKWDTFLRFFPLQIELTNKKLSINSALQPTAFQSNQVNIKSQFFLVLLQLAKRWLADSMSSKQNTQHCWCTSRMTPLLHNSTRVGSLSWSNLHPHIQIFDRTDVSL